MIKFREDGNVYPHDHEVNSIFEITSDKEYFHQVCIILDKTENSVKVDIRVKHINMKEAGIVTLPKDYGILDEWMKEMLNNNEMKIEYSLTE